MNKEYTESVQYLENLQMMPKTMPGLFKMKCALEKTSWFGKMDASKIIVVAGTNGKGTTCAALESLLIEAGQNVGFYSSPHLVSTTERIRIAKQPISERKFVEVFEECLELIRQCELSHFEALTLMAGHYFFSEQHRKQPLDFVILEVGLGGSFDATNAFPHKYNIITKLGMDHTNILGSRLSDIASNKFGIVTKKSIVVHQPLASELAEVKALVKKETNSNWIESDKCGFRVDKAGALPRYFITVENSEIEINIAGKRAAENIMNAVTLFQILGFDLRPHKQALNRIDWPGRMQKITWPGLKCPLFLSGDHNEQGVESLIEILQDFHWRTLHLIVGIGTDKAVAVMLERLCGLSSMKLYLTETPFKGLGIEKYPASFLDLAVAKDKDIKSLLEAVAKTADSDDLCIVTGSLYLVGLVLKLVPAK